MANRKVVESYYNDINGLADLLGKFVNSYRLLIGGAAELNQIGLASRRDIKHAIKRADKLGEIIDALICNIHVSTEEYLNYCKLKEELLNSVINNEFVRIEIEEELKK